MGGAWILRENASNQVRGGISLPHTHTYLLIVNDKR